MDRFDIGYSAGKMNSTVLHQIGLAAFLVGLAVLLHLALGGSVASSAQSLGVGLGVAVFVYGYNQNRTRPASESRKLGLILLGGGLAIIGVSIVIGLLTA